MAWCWHWHFVILFEAYKPKAKAKLNNNNLPSPNIWIMPLRYCSCEWVHVVKLMTRVLVVLSWPPYRDIKRQTHSYKDAILVTPKWGTRERLQAGSRQQTGLKETSKHLHNCSLVTTLSQTATCWHVRRHVFICVSADLFYTNKHSWWEGAVVSIWKESQIYETLMNYSLPQLTHFFGGKSIFSCYIYSVMTRQKPMSSLVCFLLHSPCLHRFNRCLHLLSGICFVCVTERCSCDFRRDVRCFVVEKRSFVFTLQRVKSQ